MARPRYATPLATSRSRGCWVVAELDGRGEIDGHAAMCLRHGIAGALAQGPSTVVVDLRDLTAIGAAGVALLAQLRADCRANAIELRLLICDGAHHGAIAHALTRRGLAIERRFAPRPLAAQRSRTTPELLRSRADLADRPGHPPAA